MNQVFQMLLIIIVLIDNNLILIIVRENIYIIFGIEYNYAERENNYQVLDLTFFFK